MSTKSERKEAEKYVAQNRKARHDYTIDETFEAGLVLTGSEVKSLREQGASLLDAYANFERGELWLRNSHIPEYKNASYNNHEARRSRKLLLHKAELNKLVAKVEERGMTIVPLGLYFSERGHAKVEIGVARGKKNYDRRQDIAERDTRREIDRALKHRQR